MKNMLILALLLAACGDNNEIADGGVDAPVDAGPAPTRAVIVTGDFTPGSPGVMSVLDVATKTVRMNVAPAMAIGEDPILRKIDNELFVVNRASGNNVTILDAEDFSLVEQLGTGASSNPQDVAVIGQKLFVATLGNKGIVELTRGSTTITEIDLSVDDPDGKPNCNSIHRVGGDLYVSCGLLDDTQQFLPPRGPGKIYVVNAASRAITNTITMTTENPFSLLEEIPVHAPNAGDLVINTVNFGTGAGCVERIATGASAAAAGCIVTNAQMGNFASRVDFHAVEFTGPVAPIVVPPMMYAVVPSQNFVNSDLHGYEMAGMVWSTTALNPTTQVIKDVAACPTGELIVADGPASGTGGLRIYTFAEQTTEALPVGKKPASPRGLVCY